MKNTSIAEQVCLMIDMLNDELRAYAPPVQGHVSTERSIIVGKLQVLKKVQSILIEGSQEERNRHKEIWTHFLTILNIRREEYKDVEYDNNTPFPEEVLTTLEKDYVLYLRSHGLHDLTNTPNGGRE